MKIWGTLVIACICAFPAAAASDTLSHTVKFSAAQSEAVGAVEKLVVTVSCGSIVTLQNVPELYNLEMGYDLPTVNVLEARPRLGGAAVSLTRWSGVVTATGSGSCFSVAVHVEGRASELDLGTSKQTQPK